MPSRLAKIGRSLPGSTIRAHMGWACSSATTTTSKSVLCRANSAGGAGTRLVVNPLIWFFFNQVTAASTAATISADGRS